MTRHKHFGIRELVFRLSEYALALTIVFVLTVVASRAAQAQYTYTELHNFTGGQDGANPEAGLTMDVPGNLYGTAVDGGNGCSPYGGCGTVFKLKRSGSNFLFDPLYSFISGDGTYPSARVIFGPNGTLYGTTPFTYENGYFGTVFNLRPFPTVCKVALCTWMETPLYIFQGGSDGAVPGYGDLLFDGAGNIYGTTEGGGTQGVVYELTPSGSGYKESVLYSFSGGTDGSTPYNGVIFDNGNLYGTTYVGGLSSVGTVFELTPQGGGRWTESCLYSFRNGNDGGYLWAGLIPDQSGNNLYGATSDGGTGGGGTVFELTLGANCSWTLKTLYSLTGTAGKRCGPRGTLFMDGSGNLYGTTYCDGVNNAGSVFMLTPTSQPPWTYTSLHDFTGGSDGGNPYGNVVFDANGNIYGTASTGGSQTVGVVWELVKN